jgi:hypothetical protein
LMSPSNTGAAPERAPNLYCSADGQAADGHRAQQSEH